MWSDLRLRFSCSKWKKLSWLPVCEIFLLYFTHIVWEKSIVWQLNVEPTADQQQVLTEIGIRYPAAAVFLLPFLALMCYGIWFRYLGYRKLHVN